MHIQGAIQPKVGGASKKHQFIMIQLEIAASGEIHRHTVVKTQASVGFIKKVKEAIRLARLDPLPEALAKHPPYIVRVRFTTK